MPVAQGGPPPARQAITVGLAALLGLLALVFLVTRFDRLGGDEVTQLDLDNPTFTVGQAADFAPTVAESGPLLFPGPTSGSRDLWLQHLGDAPDEGWLAFSARPPGDDPDCVTEWQPDSETFLGSCDGSTYPADGDGLAQYPVQIGDDGRLTILLTPQDPTE